MSQIVTLNSVVIDGIDCDADYILRRPGVGGLGVPDVEPRGVGLSQEHGSVAGADYTGTKMLRVPTLIDRTDQPEGEAGKVAMQAWRALTSAWPPAGSDQTLLIHQAGIGPSDDTLRFYGRPRGGLRPNLELLEAGIIQTLATFEALDPKGYGPADVTAGSAGVIVVNNPGNVASRRATITITGDGSVPSLVNASDGSGQIAFSKALGNGDTWVVDLYRQTVVDSNGDSVFEDNVTAASLWFSLQPGDNSITLSGAGSASFSHRSAWWV